MNKIKYLMAACMIVVSQFSYSQALYIDGNSPNQQVIIDTYGMHKDVVAVTAVQQGMRKDTRGQTLKHMGINHPINRQVSGKYEIAGKDFLNTTFDHAADSCASLLPRNAWRVPTLNEALLMVLFFNQMKVMVASNTFPTNFSMPLTSANDVYATSTKAYTKESNTVEYHYYYFWDRVKYYPKIPMSSYYRNSPSTEARYRVRCIRDIPQ